ncbi:MAG: hypothetical protein WCE62_12690 [Polyangiales bacterium]
MKLFLLALRTPVLRDYLVSPKGIVAAMKLGVVHKERLNRELLTAYTAPFETEAARQALIRAGSGLGTKGLAQIAHKLPSLEVSLRLIHHRAVGLGTSQPPALPPQPCAAYDRPPR